jgi:uncharacterized RDD family membrane protein YckC/DNA-directed RNA polymerase subunit RPC12/RpoP
MDATVQPPQRFCSECGRPTPPDELARFGDHLVCPYCKDLFVQRMREGAVQAPGAFQYGGFWIRFVARILDGIIMGIIGGLIWGVGAAVFMPGLMSLRTNNLTPDETLAAMAPFFAMLGLITVITIGLNCIYETFFVTRMGATPGKMALGLKVVRPDGGPVTAGRAAGRYFATILSGMILYIGYIIAAFDDQKKALHDMICDTRVIRTKG